MYKQGEMYVEGKIKMLQLEESEMESNQSDWLSGMHAKMKINTVLLQMYRSGRAQK